MALRVSATMALSLLFSLIAVAHCAPLATNASSVAIPAAEVHAIPDEQGILRLPSSDDSVMSDAVVREGEVPGEEEAVKHVAEPDPDRSLEGQQGDEKTKEPADGDDEEDELEEIKKKTKKDHDEKKKSKKDHGCDGKGKKEKKAKKKHHQSNGEEEVEEEKKTKKQIHRHHRVEEETKKRLHHNKNKDNNGNDSDDEDEKEKKAKRWRKAISSRSMFGHGRRSQREEAATEETKN
ncbi:hypothetical protein BAE44_0010774 [Dichanthelium oligosanthes]|uniref:Uncharacterized protein n=1 Tax=Dichanthelium oligosanthes TaxID=888268 RepID=A0A1E5VSW9_9POAL|nr:hypothetical protein BAE44_0010774 [Dichanthelium oligosanthes]